MLCAHCVFFCFAAARANDSIVQRSINTEITKMASAEHGPILALSAVDAVTEFFTRLSRDCAKVDFDATEPMFAQDVYSFGTKARVVQGRDRLRAEQWQGIWPNIADFSFDLEQVHGSGNDTMAWGMAPWNSTGFDEQGASYERPGRATVVLERRGEQWQVIHTHFSLVPGTPYRTFGRKPAG
ncbi:MAG: ketosteroid isomerase-like protein [Gammaproteobacteria bacterium]|jgi:ketosteroid isomerase-like protein